MSEPLTDEEIAELRADCNLPGIVEFQATDVARLLDFAERARKLLGEIEWSGHDAVNECPSCRARQRFSGHLAGCELAALIGAK